MHRKFVLFLALAVGFVAIDQMVKSVSRLMADGVEGRVFAPWIPGVFELKLVYNEGVAFGMFQGGGVLLAPIAVVISIYAVWASLRGREHKVSYHVMHGLLVAGAIGNLIDRVAYRRVTDMFWIRLIDFPVFNVADVCITVAGAMILLGAIGEWTKKSSHAPVVEVPEQGDLETAQARQE